MRARLFDSDSSNEDRGHRKEAEEPRQPGREFTPIERKDKKIDQRPDHEDDQDGGDRG